MRRLILALMILSTWVQAAELSLEIGAVSRSLSSAELLAHPQARWIEIVDDVSYKRVMRYRAVPLTALLPGINPDDHLQAVAHDGFAAELPARLLLNRTGAQPWLAVEDPRAPWPPLAPNKASAGPFYLVWTNPQASRIGAEQWPFRIAQIRRLPPVEQRFPQLLPAKDAGRQIQAGFAQYQKHCMACHRLNGAGDSRFGPDLNIPSNPTEYFAGDYLARYIRDPQSVRRWPQGRMPRFDNSLLSDGELAQLLAYLAHMAGRKVLAP
ncbi:cytochrome c [Pseudomonas benzenivorans]|uniref:Cytochrome c n=1 Tax=Pseudomonas benzenivorans TaxID=556533 RepID=A0ABY5HB89_9PSED|nr:cytochrome c [Pseudomonas benzenivorans]UTW08271.1 cytochrome c [Pseudomonas benzenivorans]